MERGPEGQAQGWQSQLPLLCLLLAREWAFCCLELLILRPLVPLGPDGRPHVALSWASVEVGSLPDRDAAGGRPGTTVRADPLFKNTSTPHSFT